MLDRQVVVSHRQNRHFVFKSLLQYVVFVYIKMFILIRLDILPVLVLLRLSAVIRFRLHRQEIIEQFRLNNDDGLVSMLEG